MITRYSHLSAFALGIVPGKAVSAGQIIRQFGATGRANGPHVQSEVRPNGRAVDPKPYLALAACPGKIEQEPMLEALAPPEPTRRKR
jgi:murein DD-endopeptidase MepM/ murein hydrolase activator NlpD